MPRTKHGMSRSNAYRRWIYMKARCATDPRYVDKGITVCERWLHSFENFYADMGDPPPGLTLDRVDSSKGYAPDNCRWATYKEQNRNLSTNIRVDGEFLSDIALRAGVKRQTVEYRLRNGLPLDAPAIANRDTCKKGHQWTEENTYLGVVRRKQGNTRTQRYCRECRKLYQRQRRMT